MYWLMARVHPTWHFTAVCMGIVVGVAAAQWLSVSYYGVLFIAGLALLISFAQPRRMMLVAAMVAGALLGVYRGSVIHAQGDTMASYIGRDAAVQGMVAGDVSEAARGVSLKLKDVQVDKQHVSGEIWISGSEQLAVLKRSDTATIKGRLLPGFGTFTATIPRAQLVRVEREKSRDPALLVRDTASEAVRTSIAEPAASLGIGYLLGQKSALPVDLNNDLVAVGLTHIVVASGYNLMVLVRFARRLFAPVSKYLAVMSSGLMVAGFIMVAGASPSMVRAGIVAALGLWAWYYGRKFHPVTLIMFVAAITVLVNPYYAWGDLGWQLSFAAFVGVMIVAPLLYVYFLSDRPKSTVSQLLIEAVAAQAMTAPIIMMAFGQFSAIAIVGNLIVLPFVPLAMVLVAVAGVGGWLVPAMGHVVGWPAETLLNTMIAVIHRLAEVEWAQVSVALNGWGVVAWYALVLAACWYIKYKTKYQLYQASVVE